MGHRRRYDITVHSSAGEQHSHLELEEADGVLSGAHWTDDWSHPVADATLSEDGLSWTSEVDSPFDAKLTFKGQCEDDVCSIISGEVDGGRLGRFHFKGKRR